MMVERWLMHERLQLAHDRLAHLLGADDLAALRLDVGGAQPLGERGLNKSLVHILRFGYNESARISQLEAIGLQSKFALHLNALPLSKGIN